MSDPYNDLDRAWSDRLLRTYGNFTDHPVGTVVQWVLTTIAVLVVLSLIANALGIVNAYWGGEQAKLTEPGRVVQATYGTGNALANIAYFHDQCNTILADEQQVKNAAATLASDKQQFAAATDPITQSQLGTQISNDNTELLGVKDQLVNDVQDYDSKSATQTANPFKAHNLPYRIVIASNGRAIDTDTHDPIQCH